MNTKKIHKISYGKDAFGKCAKIILFTLLLSNPQFDGCCSNVKITCVPSPYFVALKYPVIACYGVSFSYR